MKSLEMLLWAVLAFLTGAFTIGSGILPPVMKNLSDITYRFSSCGEIGREGPAYIDCLEYYEYTKNPVLQVLQKGDTGGIQAFTVPRNGTYIVTVAGGRGGEGICQPSQGFGYSLTVSLDLTRGEEMEVIVGQRGLSSCEEGSNLPHICSIDWQGRWEECNSAWIVYANATVFNLFRLVQFEGGGGGGGATVLRRVGSPPLVVAAGGGGGGAVHYPFYSDGYSSRFAHSDDASSPSTAIWDQLTAGESGFISTRFSRVPGVGAGNRDDVSAAYQQDGQFLAASDGPLGGMDCLNSPPENHPLLPSYGGFGGGGGGCEGGGGGGGYTGGRVGTVDSPEYWWYMYGEGGYSFVDSSERDSILSEGLNTGDGHVSMYPTDCNCADSCTMVSTMFYCTCDNSTTLAPDGFDCYNDFLLLPEDHSQNLLSGQFNFVAYGISPSGNQTSFNVSLVYSILLTLSIQPTAQGSGGVSGCAVLLANGDTLTGTSATFLGSSDSGKVRNISLQAVSEDTETNLTVFANASLFQSVPIPATHLLTVGYQAECTLMQALLYTSVRVSDPVEVDTTAVLSPENRAGVLQFLSNQAPTIATTMIPESTVVVTVVVAVIISAMLIAIALTCAIIAVLFVRRSQFQKKSELYSRSLQRTDRAMIVAYTTNPQQAKNGMATKHNGSNKVEVFDSMNLEYREYEEVPDFQPNYEFSYDGTISFTGYNEQRVDRSLKEWEFPREHLVYMKELGEGQFGKVHLMKAKNICGHKGSLPVAVKILSNLQLENMRTFYEEMEIMKQFTHANIVSFLGLCSEMEDGAPMIILELMEFGDLKQFLIKHRPVGENTSALTNDHFYRFAADISSALAFLASKQYVHRDVAARNCLVGRGLCVKLADFGLARAVHDKDYYRVQQGTVLPLRWMAAESVKYGIFTLESDVWSFGVLLWEIASFAQHPYTNVQPSDLVTALDKGLAFLPKPDNCSGEIYSAIQMCQSYTVEKRPKMTELYQLFSSLCPMLDNSQIPNSS